MYGIMNAIRCCISCILPCGALDVIRIVHCNGRVEEITGTITAYEIMKAYPKHVLKKPSSPSDGVVPEIVILPPEAQLKRGKIYFLMPVPCTTTPEKAHKPRSSSGVKKKKKRTTTTTRSSNRNDAVQLSDQYLSEMLSEKFSTQRTLPDQYNSNGRRGRVAVWRPRLESICESPNDDQL